MSNSLYQLSRKRHLVLASIVLLDKINYLEFLSKYYFELISTYYFELINKLSDSQKYDILIFGAWVIKGLLKLLKISKLLMNLRLVLDWLVVLNPYDQPWETLRLYTQPWLNMARFLVPTRSGAIFTFDFTMLLSFRLISFFEKTLRKLKVKLLYQAYVLDLLKN